MKKIYIIIGTLLFISLIILGYKYYLNKKELSDNVINISNLEQSIHLLKYSILQSVVFGSENKLLRVKTNEGEVLISDILDGMNTIVFRFSAHSCEPCLNRELANISHLEKQGVPVLIVATYSNPREFRLLLKKFDIGSRYILLEEGESLCSFENTSSDLFVFLLDPDANIRFLFFPVQNEDNLSIEYFDFIEALFKKHRK